MSDLPFGGRVSVDGGVQSITLIHGPSSLLPPCCCCTTALPLFRFSLRISVVLSHHLSLADRRTDGRLSRVRSAPFLFFTSGVPGGEIRVSVCFPSSPSPRPRGLAGIKLLPRRELMLPAVNSSYFSRRVILRRHLPRLASPRLVVSPLTRDFYFNGDGLSWIVPPLLCTV